MVEPAALLDRYRLEDRIASGGMGSVHAAYDERLSRRVAVKVLNENLAEDPRFVERFRREARAVAALSHPNIASVFDYGRDGERHFIVMELAEGDDLARILRQVTSLSVDRAARVAIQICAALDHAHGGGIVHRDVKPGNVIIGPGDAVKVTDFGIARAAGDSTLTATGSVLGTAHYLSPEQAAGGNVGPPSDIYSLGIVVYEMLTGSVPFTGDSAIAVAMRHASERVAAPSAVAPEIPPELDAIVLKATAPDPEERFASAAEMGSALKEAARPTGATAVIGAALAPGISATRELRSTEVSDAETPPPAQSGWGARRAGRVLMAAIGVLAIVAASLLLVRALTGSGEPDPPQRAEEQPRQAEPDAEPAGFELADAFIGMNYEEAKDSLEERGFKVEDEDVESDEPEDTVVDMNPRPGSVVQAGDTITLYVSEGPADDDENGRGRGEGRGKGNGKEKDDD